MSPNTCTCSQGKSLHMQWVTFIISEVYLPVMLIVDLLSLASTVQHSLTPASCLYHSGYISQYLQIMCILEYMCVHVHVHDDHYLMHWKYNLLLQLLLLKCLRILGEMNTYHQDKLRLSKFGVEAQEYLLPGDYCWPFDPVKNILYPRKRGPLLNIGPPPLWAQFPAYV